MAKRSKVTIQQIADAAGVSKFAASRALSGKSGVSDETREMIVKTALQLGYYNNTLRRKMPIAVEGRDAPEEGTIIVLFPDVRYQNEESAYWGPIFEGIAAGIAERGLHMITVTEPTGEGLFHVLNPEAIIGVITIGEVSGGALLEMNRLGMPVVMVDHVDPVHRTDLISADNYGSMHDLMTQLIGKGYRTFQFVGHIAYAHSFRERWTAYEQALLGFGLQAQQDSRLIGEEAERLEQWLPAALGEMQLPDVFVCANDHLAVQLLEACQALGIRVPEQCAVTGFDDTFPQACPALTTVRVHTEWMGRRATDKLMWRIANRSALPEKVMIYGEPLLRASTR
ncbi:LacI family DNA-binding transcriptional regulator [Paenibacillus chungangensis]|uniref:LacI family DNA-binding transcriptional regulator n=1 Tax=Paenibacillus chungangensis TaxID=696535 RepID=A0ABW3HXI7_9BACL